jgi:Na+-driven multidrug efflux pump
MQTPPEAFDAAVSYVRICASGTLFIVAYNVLGSIFRGMGDSRMPLLTVLFACVFNIAGDFLLVGVFHLAAAGAAIATVAAQALSVMLSFAMIRRRKLPFVLSVKQVTFSPGKMGAIFKLGFPIAFQDLLVSVSFGCHRYCQHAWRDCLCRRRRGRKAVRVYHAGAVGV